MIRAWVCLCLTVLIVPEALARGVAPPSKLAGAAGHVRATVWARDELKDLIADLRKAGDQADPAEFERLAQFGGRKALKGLTSVAHGLKSILRTRQAYLAFLHFRDDPKLLPKVIDQLEYDALKYEGSTHKRGAATALAELGPLALESLEKVLDKSQDTQVRRLVVAPLVGILAARGSKPDLDVVLEVAQLSGEQRERIVEGLRQAVADPGLSGKVVADLARRLENREVAVEVKTILLDALVGVRTPRALSAMETCAEHEHPAVSLRAIELIGDGGDPLRVRGLRVLTTRSDESVVRESIGAMGKLLDDEEWHSKVLQWKKDGRLGARMGACLALASSAQPDALEHLHSMLIDEDWRVRVEAIDQVTKLRELESVPVLIERMDHEEGRLYRDLILSLKLLTGIDQGQSRARWESWWKGEGANFELPTLEEAIAAQHEREARLEEDESTASFYGLNIVSSSVVFVVDVSQSMEAPATGDRIERESTATASRMDVARDELRRVIDELRDKVIFNIILFATEVQAWENGLVPMSPKVRKRALDFVSEFRMGRATNTYGGLLLALEDDRVETIYLMSDGAPSAGEITVPDEIRGRIDRLNRVRKVRIHTVAIGEASTFLRKLAEDSGGVYAEIL